MQRPGLEKIGRPRRQRLAGAPRITTILAFVGPALLLYSVVYLYPILSALINAFFSWQGSSRLGFAGLANFTEVMALEPYASQLSRAVWNNLYFFAGAMIVQNGAGLLLALALQRALPGKRFFQVVFSAPYLMSALVIGYAWSMLLSPRFGVVNSLLATVGLEGRAWLADPTLIMPILILINAWQWSGVPMLIFGASLAGIPEEQIEAAKIDGAGYWRIVGSVKLPQLIPAFSVVTVLTFIGSMNLFDLVYAIGGTSGGAGGAADVLGTLFYRVSFSNSLNSAGLSGALSVIQFVLILIVTIGIQRGLSALDRRYGA